MRNKGEEEMEENNVEKVEKKRLAPASTVLITIAATLGIIVLAGIIYFIVK